MPALDYFIFIYFMDILYMHAPSQVLHMLNSVYQASLLFITNCKPQTHDCELHSRVGWSDLATRRCTHWYRLRLVVVEVISCPIGADERMKQLKVKDANNSSIERLETEKTFFFKPT